MAGFQREAAQQSNVSQGSFKPADTFANSSSIVLKDGTLVPFYAPKGMALYIENQNDARAKAILEQVVAKQEAGEDVEMTVKVVFRAKRAQVVADSTVSIADLL